MMFIDLFAYSLDLNVQNKNKVSYAANQWNK